MVYRGGDERTLTEQLPELIEHLDPGMTVLDVGCGPGAITLDVAQIIVPGRITGIDINAESPWGIEAAAALALTRSVPNASFEVMDAHELQLADNSFDLVFSYTVAHFWLDPTKVLRELKRVAKPGSLVITAGIRDFGFVPRYPACPTSEQVWAGLAKCMKARQNAYRSGSGASRTYWDFYAARKCVQWYADAGLEDLQLSSQVEEWWYPASSDRDAWYWQALRFEGDLGERLTGEAVADGFLDQETVDRAREEMAQWQQNPHAFYFHPLVTAIGRA